jgi:hypothetical protein
MADNEPFDFNTLPVRAFPKQKEGETEAPVEDEPFEIGISWCSRKCQNLNPDGTCKVLNPIPEKVKLGVECDKYQFDGEEP